MIFSANKKSEDVLAKVRNEPKRWELHGWCPPDWANCTSRGIGRNYISFKILILLQDSLIGARDILIGAWATLSVGSYYKLYYAIVIGG